MSHIYENTLHCQNLIGDLRGFEGEYLLTFIKKYIKRRNKIKITKPINLEIMAKRKREKRNIIVPKRKIYINDMLLGSVRICLNPIGIPAPSIISFQFKFFTLPNGTVMGAVKNHLNEINAFKRVHIEHQGLNILISEGKQNLYSQ